MSLLHEELSEKVIGVAIEVLRELGPGFLESVYQNALMLAFAKAGLKAESRVPLTVTYRDTVVGIFEADIVVDEVILLELKAIRSLAPEHLAQVINYLKATGLQVGLLLNFGNQKLEVRRLGNTP